MSLAGGIVCCRSSRNLLYFSGNILFMLRVGCCMLLVVCCKIWVECLVLNLNCSVLAGNQPNSILTNKKTTNHRPQTTDIVRIFLEGSRMKIITELGKERLILQNKHNQLFGSMDAECQCHFNIRCFRRSRYKYNICWHFLRPVFFLDYL